MLTAKMELLPVPPSELSPDVPHDLDSLTMRLLAFEPEERPGTDEILAILEEDTAPPAAMRSNVEMRVAPFVGRDAELSQMERALAEVPLGATVTVLIESEGGLGKTTLVREFLRLHATDSLAIVGRCYEREALPYKGVDGVMDALASHWRTAQPEGRTPPRGSEHLTLTFPAFASLPDFAAVARTIPRDATRVRMALFAAARNLFAWLAQDRPLIVVVDDWHWSDADSVALMRDVLRPPSAPALLLVATVRPLVFDRESSPVDLPGDVRTLRLEGLSPPDSIRLAQALLDGSVGEAVVARLAAEAGGNPRFFAELARDQVRRFDDEGPVQLDRLIQRRVAALDPPSRRLLETVGVAGGALPLTVVGAASALTPSEVAVAATTLSAGHLSRGVMTASVEGIEPYHDRVRDAVTAGLSPEAMRARHAKLAAALMSAHWPDPEAIARHFIGAGDEARAVPQLLLAAGRAEAAAAFGLAARLYERAFGLRPLTAADRARVAEKVATAFSHAGLGRDAARAYERASALALRRRAAEEQMLAGEIDDGIAAATRVLQAVKLRYPRGTLVAIAGILWWRFLCLVFGWRWRPEHVPQPRRDRLTEQLDACTGLAYAIAIVDPIRGAYLQALAVFLTFRLGDARRMPVALSLHAAFYAAAGARKTSVVEAMYTGARRWMAETGDIEPRGFVEGCHGLSTYLLGNFTGAAEYCRSADSLIAQDRPGGYWDQRTVRTTRLWALAATGRLADLAEASEDLRREADARGDLAASTARRLANTNLTWLRIDQSVEARPQATSALAAWPQKGVHIPLFWATYAEAQIDLYEGNSEDALRRIDEKWRAFRRAFLFEVEITHLEALDLRARALLGTASRQPVGERSRYVQAARRDTETIRRSAGAHAKSLAHALDGGSSLLEGNVDAAAEALRKALAGFELQGMQLHAAAMRRSLARLCGEAEAEAEAAAQRYFDTDGVVNADAMTRLLAPTFDAIGEISVLRGGVGQPFVIPGQGRPPSIPAA